MFHATQHEVTFDLTSIGGQQEPSLEVDALVVLNSDISYTLLDYFVFNSRHIILCDGAANHFYRSKHRNAANIRAIVGDLDSIDPEVRAYYSTHVEVRDLSSDQDTNDF
jgi:thiamine pyrophosphokinase